jgi:hypothetical protein
MADTQTITPDAVPTGSLNSILKTLGQDYAAKSQQASDTSAQLATEKANIQKKLDTAESQVENLKPPAMVPMPPPPQPKATSFWEELGSPAMILAALGSLMTQTPLTTALNAGAGVMKAYREGDQEAAQHQMEVWKAATANALRLQDYQDKIYNASIKKLDTETSTALAELTANAAAFRDNIMLDAAKSRDLDLIANIQQERERLGMEVRNRSPDITVWGDMMNSAIKANGGKPLAPQQEMDLYKEFKTAQSQPKLAGKWVVAQDPGNKDANGNPVQYRYNPDTTEATTLTGQPYTPSGFAKLSTSSSAVISDETADFIAGRVIAGDPNATRNMSRTKENMTKVEDAVTKLAKEKGMSPGDLSMALATVKSDQSSLTNMTKMTDAALSFEATARENFNLALSLAPKGIPTNWGPYINKWVENGETGTGDPNVPQYVTALLTAANEYAKIMSGSTGSQGSTVDARHEAAERFSPYLNQGQIEGVIRVAEQDMANRKQQLNARVKDIQERIRGGSGGGAASSVAPAVGTVEDGYRFKGGDPANSENWEKVNP